MTDKLEPAETGSIVSDEEGLTLDQLRSTCGLSKQQIVSFIEEGIVSPEGSVTTGWQFSRTTVVTLHRAKRLERDLRLNPPGIALALDLMQRIEHLEARLARLDPTERTDSDKPV
jgi:chaperone modulatory protein CbpM